MSDELFNTRLRWCNGRGIAKFHGRIVPLTEPPVLAGEPVHMVDYTPEVRCLEIRRRAVDQVDRMTHHEIADADALLALLTR
jgi:hypothetical protein